MKISIPWKRDKELDNIEGVSQSSKVAPRYLFRISGALILWEGTYFAAEFLSGFVVGAYPVSFYVAIRAFLSITWFSVNVVAIAVVSGRILYGFGPLEKWRPSRRFRYLLVPIKLYGTMIELVIGRRILLAVFASMYSYMCAVYAFALFYMYASWADKGAFYPGTLSLFNAWYFSIMTAATVGYGDIYPLSKSARSIVMVEVFVSIGYGVFLFSVLASSIAARIEKRV